MSMEGVLGLVLMVTITSLVITILSKVKTSKKLDILFREIHQLKSDGTVFKPEEKIQPISVEKIDDQPKVVTEPELQSVTSKVVTVPYASEKEKKRKVKEEKPKRDVENFIGVNLISKIAIVILILGMAFFVKYAIDKDWVNEVGRVAVGVLGGGILIGLAHYMRNQYRAFSSVLAGGGIALLYITIAIAFHEYALFSQFVAFIIMVVITGFAVLLSIAYDRQELAVLAILGGFATPLMVSTGTGNYKVLFTYILILNTGMLVLAFHKKWYLINIISFFGTVLLFGSWLGTKVLYKEDPPYIGAMLFATLFFVEFFVMNIINNITKARKFRFFEIFMLLSNSALYYVAGMILFESAAVPQFKGLFTALMAVFNFGFILFLYKKDKVDKNLIYLLIGMVLTFLSMTAPVQLKGNYITLFWACEAVLLLWLSQQTGLKIVKVASMIVTVIMLFSLTIDWTKIYAFTYGEDLLPYAMNKGFLTSLVVIISLVLTRYLAGRKNEKVFIFGLKSTTYQSIIMPIIIVFLYIGCLVEVVYQAGYRIEFSSSRHVFIGLLNYLFIVGLMIWGRVKRTDISHWITVFPGAFSAVAYMVFYQPVFVALRRGFLDHSFTGEYNYYYQDTPTDTQPMNDVTGMHYYLHFVVALLVIAIVALLVINAKQYFQKISFVVKAFTWFSIGTFLMVLSSELDHLIVVSQYVSNEGVADILKQTHKIGYPILWGIASFVLMITGMKRKRRDLRILSLLVFFITILKLFIYDIRGINEGGKIAAFISLGILLLVVSFMYNKLKKAILDADKLTEKTLEGSVNQKIE